MFGGLLAVNLDGPNTGNILLNQVAEAGQGFLQAPLLAHHAAAEEANRHQHQGIETHRREAQARIDQQHRWQRHGIRQGRVGQAEQGKTQQPTNIFDVAGGAADHLATAHPLHKTGFLQQYVVEDALFEVGLHLAADPKHQDAGGQPHQPHHRGQGQDQSRFHQQFLLAEAILETLDDPAHQKGKRGAQEVDHHQRHHTEGDLATVGTEVTGNQIEPQGSHRRQAGH